MESWIHCEIHPPPHGVDVELLEVRTDTGLKIEASTAGEEEVVDPCVGALPFSGS